jgi:hypothetical protein
MKKTYSHLSVWNASAETLNELDEDVAFDELEDDEDNVEKLFPNLRGWTSSPNPRSSVNRFNKDG